MFYSLRKKITGVSKRTIYETVIFITLIVIILVTNSSGGYTKIRNSFVDVNQDGKIDYIVEAKVILNSTENFP